MEQLTGLQLLLLFSISPLFPLLLMGIWGLLRMINNVVNRIWGEE